MERKKLYERPFAEKKGVYAKDERYLYIIQVEEFFMKAENGKFVAECDIGLTKSGDNELAVALPGTYLRTIHATLFCQSLEFARICYEHMEDRCRFKSNIRRPNIFTVCCWKTRSQRKRIPMKMSRYQFGELIDEDSYDYKEEL